MKSKIGTCMYVLQHIMSIMYVVDLFALLFYLTLLLTQAVCNKKLMYIDGGNIGNEIFVSSKLNTKLCI